MYSIYFILLELILQVLLPPPGEYVADGAARQAAWALLGEIPQWNLGEVRSIKATNFNTGESVLSRYRNLRDRTIDWTTNKNIH